MVQLCPVMLTQWQEQDIFQGTQSHLHTAENMVVLFLALAMIQNHHQCTWGMKTMPEAFCAEMNFSIFVEQKSSIAWQYAVIPSHSKETVQIADWSLLFPQKQVMDHVLEYLVLLAEVSSKYAFFWILLAYDSKIYMNFIFEETRLPMYVSEAQCWIVKPYRLFKKKISQFLTRLYNDEKYRRCICDACVCFFHWKCKN